jgi:hypothetical protein
MATILASPELMNCLASEAPWFAAPIIARFTFLAAPATAPAGTISGTTALAAVLLPMTTPEAARPAVFRKLSLDNFSAIIMIFFGLDFNVTEIVLITVITLL